MEIINYPNYLIYEDGRVYSKYYNRFLKPRLTINLKRPDNKYYHIALSKNGKQDNIKLHRLLVQHFKPDEWNPDLQVDHINQNKLDNRLENLRCVTRSVNMQNTGVSKNNKCGVKNISYCNKYNSWIYKKTINKKTFSKSFKTKEEAIEFKKEYEKNNKINIL